MTERFVTAVKDYAKPGVEQAWEKEADLLYVRRSCLA